MKSFNCLLKLDLQLNYKNKYILPYDKHVIRVAANVVRYLNRQRFSILPLVHMN